MSVSLQTSIDAVLRTSLYLKKGLLVIIIANICCTAFSQKDLSQGNVFDKRHGIPSGLINDIEQDREGYIWIAAQEGLFRFDGSFTKPFQHSNDSSSLKSINDLLFVSNKNELWIAANEGLHILDLSSYEFSFHSFHLGDKLELVDGSCEYIYQDRNHSIWVAVDGIGLVAFDGQNFNSFPIKTEFHSESSVGSPRIFTMRQDAAKDHLYWLGTFNGLTLFNLADSSYTFLDSRKSPTLARTVTALHTDSDQVYFGSRWEEDLNVYHIESGSFHKFQPSDSNEFTAPYTISALQQESDSTFWILTSSSLALVHGESKRVLKSFVPGNKIKFWQPGFIAKNKNLWIPFDNGLLFYNLQSQKVKNTLIVRDGPNEPDILTSFIATNNPDQFFLAFNSGNAIYQYNRSTAKIDEINCPEETPDCRIPSHLVRLKDGRILAIAYNAFYELKTNELIVLPLFPEIDWGGLSISSALVDQEGYLWIGTRWGGLFRLDLTNYTFKHFQNDQLKEVEPNHFTEIRLLYQDKENRIWIRCSGGFSLYIPTKDRMINFPYLPGGKNSVRNVGGFEQDQNGNIWISDFGDGLALIDPAQLENGVIRKFRTADGLLDDNLGRIKIDHNQRAWIVSEKGLQCFDINNESFKLFSESSGFITRDEAKSLPNLIPSYLKELPGGEMVVGYRSGFGIFHTDSIETAQPKPIPYITSIKANEEEVFGKLQNDNLPFIELEHDKNLIAFEFSSIAYNEPEKIYYHFKLKELQTDWISTKKKYVSYANLKPGLYTFYLKSSYNQDPEEYPGLELSIKINAPWWANPFAYVIYLLLFISIAYWIYRFQLDRKLAQAEAERMKDLDQFKSRFYSNITHEFRTPLTIISGTVDHAIRRKISLTEKELSQIKNNSEELLNLINQLLDLNKLETGSLKVNYQQDNFILFLEYLKHNFNIYTESKGIRFHLKKNTPLFLMDFDKEKMYSLIGNIVHNAIKNTPEGGEVSIIFTGDKEICHIEIKDSGKGIPAEEQAKIFDRFYQTASGKAQGSGIGLALVKELVQLFEGTIDLKSDQASGTSFLLSFPVSRTAPTNNDKFIIPSPSDISKETGTISTSSSGPQILIIEDQQQVAQIIAQTFLDTYQITLARNGEEGIEMALEKIPDIVISDVKMPKKNGFEVCEFLKNDFRTSHIPVILLTAKTDTNSKITGLKRGADAYLPKPFDGEELEVRVQQLLQLRIRLQQRYQGLLLGKYSTQYPLQDINVEDEFMAKVIDCINSNLGDTSLDIAFLCKEVNMSRAQLHRKITALTGSSALKIIHALRLEKAKTLLKTTSMNISDIAYETGFNDPAYFSRLFSKETGFSPTEFRKKPS